MTHRSRPEKERPATCDADEMGRGLFSTEVLVKCVEREGLADGGNQKTALRQRMFARGLRRWRAGAFDVERSRCGRATRDERTAGQDGGWR